MGNAEYSSGCLNPAILLLSICLPQLCGVILRGAIGTLARPAKLWEALNRGSLFKLKSKLFTVFHFR